MKVLKLIKTLWDRLRSQRVFLSLSKSFEQDQDGTAVPSWSCSKAVYKPV